MTEATGTPILVLGNGGWRTAISIVLSSNGHDVRVWGHDAAYCEEIESSRENRKYLAGVTKVLGWANCVGNFCGVPGHLLFFKAKW